MILPLTQAVCPEIFITSCKSCSCLVIAHAGDNMQGHTSRASFPTMVTWISNKHRCFYRGTGVGAGTTWLHHLRLWGRVVEHTIYPAHVGKPGLDMAQELPGDVQHGATSKKNLTVLKATPVCIREARGWSSPFLEKYRIPHQLELDRRYPPS